MSSVNRMSVVLNGSTYNALQLSSDSTNLKKILMNNLKKIVPLVTCIDAIKNAHLVYDEVPNDTPTGSLKIFNLKHPIKENQEIQVYANDELVDPSNYTVNYKRKYITFNTAPAKGTSLKFHYEVEWSSVLHQMALNEMTITLGLKQFTNAPYNTLFYNNFSSFGSNQYMEIADDPEDAGNKVLSFVSKEAGATTSRVLTACYQMNADEIETWVDVYLPSKSWKCMESFDSEVGSFLANWITLLEYWAPFGHMPGVTTTTSPGFRITVSLGKASGTSDGLYFNITCNNKTMTSAGKEYYTAANAPLYDDRSTKKFPFPYDKWVTIHTKMKVGSTKNGYFMLECIVDDETIPIVNKTLGVGYTYFESGLYPDAPITVISCDTCLMKMYTSPTILNYIVENSESKEMRAYWRNLSWIERNITR